MIRNCHLLYIDLFIWNNLKLKQIENVFEYIITLN